ncbi:hypothetical protein [Pyxidicoccus parkwayensis]|nr:hypothetical protein [Pyxidicoccus parkwaysis]
MTADKPQPRWSGIPAMKSTSPSTAVISGEPTTSTINRRFT